MMNFYNSVCLKEHREIKKTLLWWLAYRDDISMNMAGLLVLALPNR